ncbi:unnamed protein product [Discosporangium mesarthrocarpum]
MGLPRRTPLVVAAALAMMCLDPANAFVGIMPVRSSFCARSARVCAVYHKKLPAYCGSSTSLQMNLGERFIRVAKANLNNVLKQWEDPEKVLDQAVEDMQRDLVKIRQSYAEVSASQKRMERQKAEADRLDQSWYERAQLALTNGDEVLAREALARRQQQVDTSASLSQQIEMQGDSLAKLRDSTQQLEAKITEAKVMGLRFRAKLRGNFFVFLYCPVFRSFFLAFISKQQGRLGNLWRWSRQSLCG